MERTNRTGASEFTLPQNVHPLKRDIGRLDSLLFFVFFYRVSPLSLGVLLGGEREREKEEIGHSLAIVCSIEWSR